MPVAALGAPCFIADAMPRNPMSSPSPGSATRPNETNTSRSPSPLLR